MNTVKNVLEFVLKLFTTLADIIMKIPQPLFFLLKLVPGVGSFLAILEEKKTVAVGFLVSVLAILEKVDWTNIGGWSCEVINFILHLMNKSWVCDSTWLPYLATILTAIIMSWLRILGKDTPLKPFTAKK